MRTTLILLASLLCSMPAGADLVARNGENELRLMPTACVHGQTLGRLNPEWRSRFKKAQATLGGRLHFGCWINVPDENGIVWVLLEGGDGFALSIGAFSDQPGI